MRWKFWKPIRLVPDESPEEALLEHPAEPVAAAALEDPHVLRIGDETILRGRLRYDAPEARARLDEALGKLDVSWFYERTEADTRLTVTHPKAPAIPPEWPWNLAGFLATAVSTLWAGAYLEGAPWDFIVRDAGRLADGVPFAASLLAILAAHEFGHYVAARRYGLNVTLPFFIPMPVLSPIGTLGAVIKMKTPIYTRRMLLDVGAAGPIAGMVVALPVSIWGVLQSPVLPLEEAALGIRLGEPLLFKAIVWTVGPAIPTGHELFLDSVAFAGWIGLFVTALNLLPIGQLDGGHVLYALLGRGQHWIAYLSFGSLLVMGWWWPGWYVWALLVLIVIKIRHPPVLDPYLELDPGRRAIGWIAVALFVLCFAPVPFELG
ncbi:MAG: site-2 protease family protein [Gemmatimonadetes bacterium]|nr:site-2 protease family protein [Gemmatimonadota bacterium]